MQATAKVFSTGNSQAIRLPKAFRVDVAEMWIAKNEVTGEITLKPKPDADALAAFLAELKASPTTEEFLQPRNDAPRPDPFEDWAE
jgi:antitoxin VapB